MWHLVLSAALAPLVVAADAPLDAGTQLSFRGSVAPALETDGSSGKSFDLTLWIIAKSDQRAEMRWLVDERGRGAFPWPSRSGRINLDARWRAASEGPALLYDRGEGHSVVPVPLPFLQAEQPLSAGLQFDDEKLSFSVDRESEFDGRPVWRASARDPFGPKRQLLVDRASPLVVRLTEKVILGRGEEYRLQLDLIGAKQLSEAELAAIVGATDKFQDIVQKLNLPPRSEQFAPQGEALGLLASELPAMAQAAAATQLEPLVKEVQRDFDLQAGRADAIEQLATRFEGQTVEDFSAKGLDADALSRDGLTGKVTVLHFWEYRDEPLEEPYGQVGYLDYLYHRHKADGLQLYGVAVDGRLGDAATRGAGQRSVRKLKSFMNLSYPILLDPGPLVKQFGDPRLIGASLPLFVVIGPDHKIVHYKVGTYAVDRDSGLQQLDEIVGKALAEQAGRAK